jgi:hypothetical protein
MRKITRDRRAEKRHLYPKSFLPVVNYVDKRIIFNYNCPLGN